MRESYQKDENLKLNKLYDEDIHYPILICLQLKWIKNMEIRSNKGKNKDSDGSICQ